MSEQEASRSGAGSPLHEWEPSVDDLYIAAQWLEVYEGAEDAESCRRVSEWLRAQAHAKELRDVARAAGVPVAKARAAIAKRAAGK